MGAADDTARYGRGMSETPSGRVEYDVASTRRSAVAQLVKAAVVPRPIAWVSSRSGTGVDNLAPHSFFTVVSQRPLLLGFTSVGRKDTLRNIEQTGEFVVNVTSGPLFEQVNATGTDYPPEVSEFDAVGLTREPSVTVAPPRVAESPLAMECRLHQVIPLGDGFFVVGELTHIAVSQEVAEEQGDGPVHPRIDALNPLARLGKDEWGLLGEIRTIGRIPYEA